MTGSESQHTPHMILDSSRADRVQAWAEARLPETRQAHVRGVAATARDLAARFAPDEAIRVRIAAWLHDVAKHWSPADLLRYAVEHDLPVTAAERQTPALLHGAVGYHLGATAFALDDAALAQACALHTTGGPGMHPAAKIVFVADLIEPGRSFSEADALRAAAAHDLDSAVLAGVCYTVQRLLRKERPIDPRAIALYNELIAAGITCADYAA